MRYKGALQIKSLNGAIFTGYQCYFLDERRKTLKSECPLRLSHIENMWHMIKNQNFSYSSQR